MKHLFKKSCGVEAEKVELIVSYISQPHVQDNRALYKITFKHILYGGICFIPWHSRLETIEHMLLAGLHFFFLNSALTLSLTAFQTQSVSPTQDIAARQNCSRNLINCVSYSI